MGNSRKHPSGRPGAVGPARSSLDRSAKSVKRCLVDFAHGSALAGSAVTMRAIPNGPVPLPAMGAFGSHGKTSLDAGRTSQRSLRPGSQRVFCGRDICSGQKRGHCVGKTERGKGSKIMGDADSSGLPFALRAEIALPAEVTLVQAALGERVVSDGRCHKLRRE